MFIAVFLRQSAEQVAARGRLAALMAALKPSQLLLLQPNSEPPLVQQDAAAPFYTWSLTPNCDANVPIAHHAEFISRIAAKSAAAAAAGVEAECVSAPPCRPLRGWEAEQELMSGVCLGTPSQACCAVSFWAGYVSEVRHLGRWCAGGCFQPCMHAQPCMLGWGVSACFSARVLPGIHQAVGAKVGQASLACVHQMHAGVGCHLHAFLLECCCCESLGL
jgi:hypothetical protein